MKIKLLILVFICSLSSFSQTEQLENDNKSIFLSLLIESYGLNRSNSSQNKYSISIETNLRHHNNSEFFISFLNDFKQKNQKNLIFENIFDQIVISENWKSIANDSYSRYKPALETFFDLKPLSELSLTEKYIQPSGILYFMPYAIVIKGDNNYGSLEMFVNNGHGWNFVMRYSIPRLGEE